MRLGGRAVPASLQEIKSLKHLVSDIVLRDLRWEWTEQLVSPPQRALLVEIDHLPRTRPSILLHYPNRTEVQDLEAWAEREIISRGNDFDEEIAEQIAKTKITVVNLSDEGDDVWRNGPALEHSRRLAQSAERGVELTLEDLVSKAQTPEHGEEVGEEVAEEIAEKPARTKPKPPPLSR